MHYGKVIEVEVYIIHTANTYALTELLSDFWAYISFKIFSDHLVETPFFTEESILSKCIHRSKD